MTISTEISEKQVEEHFRGKFGKYPVVTFQALDGYPPNFLIWKESNLLGGVKYKYYRLGEKVESATWLIDGWKVIPSSLVVFDDVVEKDKYALTIKLESLKDDE